jgi:ELWxxDGT repeat protein
VVFGAKDPATGVELYVSEGTQSSTGLLLDIYNYFTTYSSDPFALINFNDLAYFFVSAEEYALQLWKTDGEESGTTLVHDFGPNTFSDLTGLIVFNNTLYFMAPSPSSGHAPQLWKTDGTSAGTILVYSGFNDNGSSPEFTVVGNTLLFAADDSHGRELWKTDGTTAGTVLVKDIYPNSSASDPLFLFEHNGICYFRANDGVHGGELWRSDGTDAGTWQVIDLDPSTNCTCPQYFVASPVDDDVFYFAATTTATGTELFASDGTASGTALVKEITPGIFGSNTRQLMAFNGAVYFFAEEALWKSDGTTAGTLLVRDFEDGTGSAYLSELTPFNGVLYFFADSAGRKIFKTDGTTAGTMQAINLSSDLGGDLFNAGSLLFFSAGTAATGSELFATDGTSAGTVLIDDANEGQEGFYPENFLLIDQYLLMTGTTEQYGNELYKFPFVTTTAPSTLNTGNTWLMAYPNPFHEVMHIPLTSFEPGESIHVIVTDLFGKILYDQITTGNSTLDVVNSWPAGNYFVQVLGLGHRKLMKVIKQ